MRTDLQTAVIAEARSRIQHKPWFKGICTDNLPTDAEIREDREGAVERIVNETMYWDAR